IVSFHKIGLQLQGPLKVWLSDNALSQLIVDNAQIGFKMGVVWGIEPRLLKESFGFHILALRHAGQAIVHQGASIGRALLHHITPERFLRAPHRIALIRPDTMPTEDEHGDSTDNW